MDDAAQPIGIVQKNASDEIRVALTEFQGKLYVDVRVYSDLGDGDKRPTKKGVNLRVDRLPQLAELVQRAQDEAERRGWL